MSSNVVYAPWAQRKFKVHAFFFNSDANILDRGVFEFETRTVEDTDWVWLSKQLDEDRVVFGDVCAADLQYDYKNSGIILGRDPVLGYVRLILAPVN